MYGHTYSKNIDQPGKQIANPARGQLNRGKIHISLSAFAPENLVSREGFGSPVPSQPAHLHTQAESGAYLRDSSQYSIVFFAVSETCIMKIYGVNISGRLSKNTRSTLESQIARIYTFRLHELR